MISVIRAAAWTGLTLDLLHIKDEILAAKKASHATVSATKKTGKKVKSLIKAK